MIRETTEKNKPNMHFKMQKKWNFQQSSHSEMRIWVTEQWAQHVKKVVVPVFN
jgi:hypothetical protein